MTTGIVRDQITEAYDLQTEEAILGILLAKDNLLQRVLSDTKLMPSHFYGGEHRDIYACMLKLQEEGKPTTASAVHAALESEVLSDYMRSVTEHHSMNLGQIIEGDDLTADEKNAKYLLHAKHHADRIIELAQWRARRSGVMAQIDAINGRNLTQFHQAQDMIARHAAQTNGYRPRSPQQLKAEFLTYWEGSDNEAIPLPYHHLNELISGGLRRKQVTILGGWTSHGKSVALDQILSHAAYEGYRCHLYMNEMGHEERVARLLSARTGIPTGQILQRKLNSEQVERVRNALDHIPFSITPCAGWSVNELAYDIKAHEFDLIGIDILHQFDYDSEIDLTRLSRTINRLAKQKGCHIIATVHLNEQRAEGMVQPRPARRDIRGSGMIKNDADNVMMVYREQHPYTGDPLAASSIYFCKARNGQVGGQSLIFDHQHMRFITEG